MLFNHFTWQQYAEALTALLLIYYALVIGKFYAPEVAAKLDRRQPAAADLPEALRYDEPVVAEEAADPLVQQTEQLIAALKAFIRDAPSQPAAIASGIRAIFKNHESIKETQLRSAINELVVTECEKNGAALLTEAEVDQWWDAPAGGA